MHMTVSKPLALQLGLELAAVCQTDRCKILQNPRFGQAHAIPFILYFFPPKPFLKKQPRTSISILFAVQLLEGTLCQSVSLSISSQEQIPDR